MGVTAAKLLPLQRNISCTEGNEITCELITSHMSSTWVLWESPYNKNWINMPVPSNVETSDYVRNVLQATLYAV